MVASIQQRPVQFGLLLLAALASVIGLAFGLGGEEEGGEGEQSEVPGPAGTEMAVVMIRAGLDGAALAAAGVPAEDVGDVVDAVAEYRTDNPGELEDADADYAAARGEEARLRRLVRSGLGTPADTAAYQQAATDLEDAETAREAALDGLFEAGIDGCSTAQQDCLSTVRGNRHWKLDVEYLAVDRTEAEWVDLRDALGGIKVSLEEGETPHPGCVSLVSQCEAVTAVSTAQTNVETTEAAVQTAWNTAVSD